MITPRRADLAGLWTPPAPNDPYRQGVIESFDPATGANTVRVGGAVLTNLPILVSGDTVNYAEDDAVILMRYQGSWAILGRVVVPGSEALTAAAVDFYAGGSSASFFNITNSFTTQGSLTVPTPAWANAALFFATTLIIAANTSGASDSVRLITDINGVGGPESIHQCPDGNYQVTTAPVARELGVGTAYSLGASTLVEAKVRCNGVTTWTGGGIRSTVNAIAIFRRV